jgi:catechol 2,3-dioxygenase-like lactoylglutathione lyase family enzyme
MDLSIQTTLLIVGDLDRSLEFYRDVFDLRLLAQGNRYAALLINEGNRRQVLVLREAEARAPVHAGRDSVGLKLFALEAGSMDELAVVEQRLVQRHAFTGRRRTETWEVVLGVDPDRVEVSVSSSVTGDPIASEDWRDLDEMIYTVGG